MFVVYERCSKWPEAFDCAPSKSKSNLMLISLKSLKIFSEFCISNIMFIFFLRKMGVFHQNAIFL